MKSLYSSNLMGYQSKGEINILLLNSLTSNSILTYFLVDENVANNPDSNSNSCICFQKLKDSVLYCEEFLQRLSFTFQALLEQKCNPVQ